MNIPMPIGPRGFHAARLTVANPEGLPAHMHGRVRELLSLEVPAEFRRQGLATELMKRTAQEADGAQMILFVHVLPYADGLQLDSLEDFYAKFGFVVIQENPRLMAREPRKPNPRLARLIADALH